MMRCPLCIIYLEGFFPFRLARLWANFFFFVPGYCLHVFLFFWIARVSQFLLGQQFFSSTTLLTVFTEIEECYWTLAH